MKMRVCRTHAIDFGEKKISGKNEILSKLAETMQFAFEYEN